MGCGGNAQRDAQLKPGWGLARQKALARNWREKGRFPVPNRYDRLPEGTIYYKDINYLRLAASLAKVGGRVWAHPSAFSLAACSICGSIFSIA